MPKPSYSYTKILKSKQPVNNASVPETKSVKQDFSFSNDSHWPTLGESLPLYKTPEKNSKASKTEKRDSNPWVKKSNESSPTKFLTKNPWQEKGMAEQATDAFIQHKTTETNSPLKSPGKNTSPQQERSKPEHNRDASVRPKSIETNNSTKKFANISGVTRQERSTAEQFTGDSVRSRITGGNSKAHENSVKTKQSHTQRKAETNSRSDHNAIENKKPNLPKDKSNEYNQEPRSQKSYAKTATNTDVKEIHKQNQEGTQAKQNTEQNDSDLFQWQVIGEKKNKIKKPKIKPEDELGDSAQFPKLVRGDGNKHRVLPDKPAQDDKIRENQENINKKKYVDVPKGKGANSTSTREASEGAIRKDTKTLKPSQKEKKKPRPTRVTSLANCSNKKEIRANPKAAITSNTAEAAAAAAPKPLSEEALQKKLAFKLMKKEEKMRKREMKILQARMASRDTKVSVISSVFLEKTQATNKTSMQPSNQINLTFEEYPSLQMQRKVTKRDLPQTPRSLPSHTDTCRYSPSLTPGTSDHQASPSLQTTTEISQNSDNKLAGVTKTSQKVRQKSDDLLSGLLPINASDDDDDDGGGLEQAAVTYRKALLSAKAIKVAKQDTMHSEPPAKTLMDVSPPKKQIRTKDPLTLNLQALAAKCRKNKKREAAYLEEKYLSAKRKDDRDDEFPARKPGSSVLPKVAGVVAKRGKINTKKPKKRKISRVMKCKIEKRQKEAVAMQLLLAQINARQQEQQQELSEALSTANNENENPTVVKTAVNSDTNEPPHTTTQTETTLDSNTQESSEARIGDSATSEPPNTATKTETDKEGERKACKAEDGKKQESDQEKNEGRTEDNDENKENSSKSSNINPQLVKTPSDDKPKIIWKIKETQEAIAQDSTPALDKTSNSDTSTEGKETTQQSSDEPKSFQSPAQLQLLANDPLVVKKASELLEILKAESKPVGPREYCHQVVTPEVNAVAKELILTLMAFQKRHYQRDPTKARIRKRYVCGLKETTKLMGKMSCVIMAPNIQQCEGPGSLDDTVEKLLNQAEKLKVPVVFALSTKEMKYLCRKSSRKVSCFGIINYQGAQDIFQRLMQLMPEAQKQYQELVASGQCSLPKDGEDEEEEEEEGEPLKKDLTSEIVNRTKSLLMAP
ncbi:titin homolog isoform X2 [Portunus trituberculatus]|nr:titin homolog isoform X2 [Portunus trituberculatus]